MKLRTVSALLVGAALSVLGYPSPVSAESLSQSSKVKLVQREGANGIKVLVPAGFTLKLAQYATGAQSRWSNPKHHDQKLVVSTGAEGGSWYEVDGVSGSITPLLPKNAKVSRVSVNEFDYRIPTKRRGTTVRGVWIASVEAGTPRGYTDLRVTLPNALKKQTNTILASFARDQSTVTNTTETSSAPSPVPTLGQPWGPSQQGYGHVRPDVIFNGGDPTGLVSGVTWESWGGATATGHGTSDYVGPNQTVAGGSQETATVVAFQPGVCNGRYMYQAIEWFYPQHGQHFDPGTYINICTGDYYVDGAATP